MYCMMNSFVFRLSSTALAFVFESFTEDYLYFPPRVEAGLTQLNTGFNDVNIINVNTCDDYLQYNVTLPS